MKTTKLSTRKQTIKQIKRKIGFLGLIRLKAVYEKDGFLVVVCQEKNMYYLAIFDLDLNLIKIKELDYNDFLGYYYFKDRDLNIKVLNKEDLKEIYYDYCDSDIKEVDEWIWTCEYELYYFDTNRYNKIYSYRDIEKYLNI